MAIGGGIPDTLSVTPLGGVSPGDIPIWGLGFRVSGDLRSLKTAQNGVQKGPKWAHSRPPMSHLEPIPDPSGRGISSIP